MWASIKRARAPSQSRNPASKRDPGKEKEVLEKALAEISTGESQQASIARRPLTFRSLSNRLNKQIEKQSNPRFTVSAEDLLSLIMILRGHDYTEAHIDRVRKNFPGLME